MSKMGCVQSQHQNHHSSNCEYFDRPTEYPHNSTSVTALSEVRDDEFTRQEKQLLRETWSVLSPDKQKHGIAVFMQIFTREPHTKQLFPFHDLHDSELLTDPLFRSHSMRFMHAIESTIMNLDALDVAFIPVLHRLGEKHVHMRGFKQDYFFVFMGSIMDVVGHVLAERCTQQIMNAWAHLGNFIATNMVEGYGKRVALQETSKALSVQYTEISHHQKTMAVQMNTDGIAPMETLDLQMNETESAESKMVTLPARETAKLFAIDTETLHEEETNDSNANEAEFASGAKTPETLHENDVVTFHNGISSTHETTVSSNEIILRQVSEDTDHAKQHIL